MRDRLLLFAVLSAAALIAALLVFPRSRRAPAPASPMPTASSSSMSPQAAALPPPSSSSSASSAPPPPPPYVRVDVASEDACGEGMVLVDGIYCPYVGHRCVSYADEAHDVCDRYAPEVLCEGRLQRRRFCVDVFEYPNLEGVKPAVMVDFNDAERACASEGKRLCTVEEWEFACEGSQMWPYPYGIQRDKSACNIDQKVVEPELGAFSDPWKISSEVARLDQRAPSGSFPRCVSPFGVHDMTGNVDEWVDNKAGKQTEKPFRSSLKGGYWGPVRARCRPITSSHNEWFSFYQVGFRCCRDAKGGTRAVTSAPPGARVPRRQQMITPEP